MDLAFRTSRSYRWLVYLCFALILPSAYANDGAPLRVLIVGEFLYQEP